MLTYKIHRSNILILGTQHNIARDLYKFSKLLLGPEIIHQSELFIFARNPFGTPADNNGIQPVGVHIMLFRPMTQYM